MKFATGFGYMLLISISDFLTLYSDESKEIVDLFITLDTLNLILNKMKLSSGIINQ